MSTEGIVEKLRERIQGRINMNQGTANIHPDPQVRHDSEVRVGVYKLVLSDLEYIAKEQYEIDACLCDARGQDPCPVHTKEKP